MPDLSDDPNGPTLGEVWRGLMEVKATLATMAGSLTAMRTDLSRELGEQVNARVAVLADRLFRVERLVYGAVGLTLTTVIVAVLSLVIIKK